MCYYTAPFGAPLRPVLFLFLPVSRTTRARSCAICGTVSMGGFNPQSSGMNRVRAHRRYHPNLQPTTLVQNGSVVKVMACTRCRRTMVKSAK